MAKVSLDPEAAMPPTTTAPHQWHGHAIDDLKHARVTQFRFDGLADPFTQAGEDAIQLA